jgi:Cft2 family RNA processing exonuclease
MKISFLGAAKIVTGSNFLIETKNIKFLIDCGLFQGGKSISRMNYEPFSFNPKEIDFMVLSHAHMDHSGRIPKLTKKDLKVIYMPLKQLLIYVLLCFPIVDTFRRWRISGTIGREEDLEEN